MPPNKSPEPTAVGACRSAVAVHVAVGVVFFVRRFTPLSHEASISDSEFSLFLVIQRCRR